MNNGSQPAGRQRADVDAKYRAIYGNLGVLADEVLSNPDLSRDDKYAQLKTFMAGFWTIFVELGGTPEFAALELKDIRERCLAFKGREATWAEQGIARVGLQEDWQRAFAAGAVKAVKDHIDPSCDLFLDLGCGWGHRMFDIWRAGVAPTARYAGGDRSDQSGDLVIGVASLFPEMDARWFHFDFLHPNFDHLPGDSRRICVFTCHAIEQVEYLGPALFDGLIARFPNAEITGIHLEPVTFQFGDDASSPPYVDRGRDLRHAKKLRYNMDLYEQVKKHPRLSVVAVEQALFDLGGGNSTSLLVWKTV